MAEKIVKNAPRSGRYFQDKPLKSCNEIQYENSDFSDVKEIDGSDLIVGG